MIILYLYIIATLAVILIFEALRQREESPYAPSKYKRQLRKLYAQQVTNLLLRRHKGCSRIVAHSRLEKFALSEAIYSVMSHTYGSNPAALQETIRYNALESFLLRRIRRGNPTEQAYALTLMSAIHSHKPSIDIFSSHLKSSYPEVRRAALIATLAARPEVAINTLRTIDYPLSPRDTQHIVSLLRRGLLPIAHEALLRSENRNLMMLGLQIVRNFGLEIADNHLQKIISTATDQTLLLEAIYTLSTLGKGLGRRKVVERLAILPARERKALCRHLTAEGYSLSALRTIFDERESLYAAELIKTYKRDLVCW